MPAIKARLVAAHAAPIIGEDDDWCRDIAERLRLADRAWVDCVSARARVPHGCYAVGSELDRLRAVDRPCSATSPISPASARCAAAHNIQNALAASACALMASGVPPGEVAAALTTFPGLPHRMEEIGRLGRVLFINDSKATNADSAAKALAAFERDIYWILGGKPKEGGITRLAPFFPRIAKAYLIGEASDGVRGHARRQGALRALRHARCGGGRGGARCGGERRRPSRSCCSRPPAPPTTSSELRVRGDAFRALVAALPGIELRGGGRHEAFAARRAERARRVVVHGRPRAARGDPGDRRRRHRALAGGEPGRR